MMARRKHRSRAGEAKPEPTFQQLPASRRISLPTLKFGYGGKPVHYYEGRLYLNGRPITRRRDAR